MKFKKSITDYWMQHYVTYFDKNAACSLCGNSGIIHTEGVRTHAGVVVGRANYCICPNGQVLREQSGNLTPHAVDVSKRIELDGSFKCPECNALWVHSSFCSRH